MDGQNDETEEEEEESVDEQAGQPMSLLSQLLFRLNVPQYVVAHHMVVTRVGGADVQGASRCVARLLEIQLSFILHPRSPKKKKPLCAVLPSSSDDGNYTLAG